MDDYSKKHNLSQITSYAKEYGFIFPTSEIYGGVQSLYDYGPLGVELKNNVKEFWFKSMTRLNNNIVGLDSSIIMHPETWYASGHIDNFSDPLIDNKDSKKRYRADNLIENYIEILTKKDKNKAESLSESFNEALKNNDLESLSKIIIDNNIKCPESGSSNWTTVRFFNLMFDINLGATEANFKTYLRPETAQGIFSNYLNVQRTSRQKIPFGIAQIGKAFRNEIVARQFIFRTREFEQMEMQYFINPSDTSQYYEHWSTIRQNWYHILGIDRNFLRTKNHTNLAHYASAALDIEYLFPFGFKEIEGIHCRTDFDLKNHKNRSKKNIEYFDIENNTHYVPHVIEVSAGLDRIILMLLCHGLITETTKERDKIRTYLKINKTIAPYKAAILPLMKKNGLPKKALEIFQKWKYDLAIDYDDSQSIGKRYTRADLIGTPYCVTVDHQTLLDDTITVRDRDSTYQERMSISEAHDYIYSQTNLTTILKLLL